MSNIYPADWDIVPFGNFIQSFKNGYGRRPKAVEQGPIVLRLADVAKGCIDFSDVRRVAMSSDEFETFRIAQGDLLFTRVNGSRDYVGKCIRVSENYTDVAFNDHLIRVRVNSAVNAHFIECLFADERTRANLLAFIPIASGAQLTINQTALENIMIPLPPLPEQLAIAAILSTWDEALTLTKRLIDALKRRKAALMQLLLTGEVRFSEFDGAWETLPLGKIANVKRGASPRPINDPQWFSETGRAWVRIADINASPTRFLNQASQYLSSLGEALSVKAEVGDLILSIAATIGVPKIVNIPACIHDGFVLITGYSDTTNGDFLYHYLSMLTSLLASGGQPGTQKNINSELVREIEIPTPDIPEQQKIADVLTIADEEILYWSSIAESLTKQKRGLMQQLLTGTVRVQVGER